MRNGTPTNCAAAQRERGFTLVELMVVVVIAALLLTIAVPSYQAYVRKSRRTEARTALLDLAAREERYFTTNNTYTLAAANLGYSTLTPVGSGYYNVTIGVGAAPLTIQNSYVITAAATGIQVPDTTCSTFSVDQTGTQTATNSSGGNTTATCWQ